MGLTLDELLLEAGLKIVRQEKKIKKLRKKIKILTNVSTDKKQ